MITWTIFNNYLIRGNRVLKYLDLIKMKNIIWILLFFPLGYILYSNISQRQMIVFHQSTWKSKLYNYIYTDWAEGIKKHKSKININQQCQYIKSTKAISFVLIFTHEARSAWGLTIPRSPQTGLQNSQNHDFVKAHNIPEGFRDPRKHTHRKFPNVLFSQM